VGRTDLALSAREANTGHVCVMCDEAMRTLMAHDILRKTEYGRYLMLSGDLGGQAPVATPLTDDGEDWEPIDDGELY